MSHKCRTESCHVAKKDGSERLDRIKDSDFGALMARHNDLESLLKGEIECRRRKPATVQTKQEAFNNYLRLIYRQPPKIRIELDEVQLLCNEEEEKGREDADIHITPFIVTPSTKKSPLPPRPAAGKRRAKIYTPPKPLPPMQCPTLPLTPPSESAPPSPPLAPPSLTPVPPSPITETPSTQKSPLPPTTATEKHIYPPPKPLPPIKCPTPPLTPPSESAPPSPPLAPPSPPKQPTPPPSSSYLPEFLLQFVDEQWFQKMFPDLSCISSSLGPTEFCVLLLDFMMSCNMAQKKSIVNALLMLIQQEALDKISLSKGLLVCLENCIHENMSREEQHFVGELLNLMVHLSPDSFNTIVELLTMLADKQVDLKALVLCVLQRLGVEEAELWLCPELESWNSVTKHQPNQHCILRDMASHWLLTWTKKCRVHKGSVSVTPVDVLIYFCSVQRSKQPRPLPPPPEGRKDAVIVPSDLDRLKPIQRLGETYSMSRIREPQGRLLPPLPYRPALMGFTRFLSLPMAYVTLSPFPFSLDFQNFKRSSTHRYFFLEHSYVEYYR